MLIGIPMETYAGETRVAVTPETVKKLKAQGHTLRVQMSPACNIVSQSCTGVAAKESPKAV